jgi:homoserine kinase type II
MIPNFSVFSFFIALNPNQTSKAESPLSNEGLRLVQAKRSPMAEYTNLSSSDVDQLFSEFRNASVRSSEPLAGGRANSSFLIETIEGQYVMTVCDAKDLGESERAVRLLEFMADAGLPTPEVYRTIDGKTTASHMGRPVVLKRFQPGEVLRDLSDAHLHLTGVGLARLHGLTPPDGLEHQFSYGLQTFSEVFEWPQSGDFGTWLKAKYQSLRQLDEIDLPRGLIHGDLFWDNIVVDGDSITLLDFEEACHYALAFDLGMAIVGCCFAATDRRLERVAALVAGYQQHRTLEPEEREHLQSFAVYGATATASWRYWQYNINLTDSPDREVYREMQTTADQIAAVDSAEFQARIS